MVGFQRVVFFPPLNPQNQPVFQHNRKHTYNQQMIITHHTHKLHSLEVNLIQFSTS